MNDEKLNTIAHLYEQLLIQLGENPQREGLQKTPLRAAKTMAYLTQGYQQNPIEILQSALFTAISSDLVLVKDIAFHSLCEHHLLPFFGKVHVAYFPDQKIVGLSKIPRVVDVFARRLQVQEQLGFQIAQTIEEGLKSKGVAVHIEATHMCIQMRGIEKQGSSTISHSFTGIFKDNLELQKKFISLLSSK